MQESSKSMFSKTEEFGSVPTPSEAFGTVPPRSESFRPLPNTSASFRSVPTPAERTAEHTLTVREVARMFEEAGVTRTERSIVKWCLPNKHDVARLDASFDANERKWFITPESVHRAIAEEQARAARNNEPLPTPSEEPLPKHSEPLAKSSAPYNDAGDDHDELRAKLRDLEIATRVKDAVIKKLEGDLQNADTERKGYIQQLIDKSHRIGSLETQLLQLDAPRHHTAEQVPNGSEPNAAG